MIPGVNCYRFSLKEVMRRFIPFLAIFSVLSLAPLSAAQPKPGSSANTGSCSDLAHHIEPVITVGQDTSQGRFLGNIYENGQTSMISPNAGPHLPLRPWPEVAVVGSPLSPLTVRALVAFADAQGFWRLPSSSAASATDAQGFFLNGNQNFISINLPCRQHTVSFKDGGDPQKFKELHSRLMDLLRDPNNGAEAGAATQ
jgi:hypothetical protein